MTNQNEVADSFANGNIPSLLKKMAIPGVISQILLLLYNMVDRIYLGRLNDEERLFWQSGCVFLSPMSLMLSHSCLDMAALQEP